MIQITSPDTNFVAFINDETPGAEKIIKGLSYLGPWCPNCGIKGEKCGIRKQASCLARKRKQTIRILSRPELFGLGFDRKSRAHTQEIRYKQCEKGGSK